MPRAKEDRVIPDNGSAAWKAKAESITFSDQHRFLRCIVKWTLRIFLRKPRTENAGNGTQATERRQRNAGNASNTGNAGNAGNTELLEINIVV